MINQVSPTNSRTKLPHDLDVLEYDWQSFPFRTWFEKILDDRDLEYLHIARDVNVSNFGERIYAARKECESRIQELNPAIQRFVREIVEPEFGAILSWQEIPTIRTHFAVRDPELDQERNDLETLGPHAFLIKHYFDNYRPGVFHRDKDYGMLPSMMNLWIPVTNVFGANSVWIGGQHQHGRDAQPICLNMGQCLVFDGATRWHGAVWNTSGTTRVSFDIRFFPKSAIAQ